MKEHPPYASIPLEVLSSTQLSDSAIRYYAFLCYWSGWPQKRQPTWYKNETAADLISRSVRTLQRAKKELEKAGLIRVEPTGNGGPDRIHMVELDADLHYNLLPRIEVGRPNLVGRGDKSVRSDDPGSLYMNYKREPQQFEEKISSNKSVTPTERTRRARSEIPDSVDRAVELADQRTARKKSTHKKNTPADRLEGKLAIEKHHDHLTHLAHINKWGGARFYEYLIHLCGLHGVQLEDTITTKKPSHALTGAMEVTIKQFKAYGSDNEDIYHLLEWVVVNWNKLRKRLGDNPMSIFVLRYRASRIHRLYKDKASLKKTKRFPKLDLDEYFE